MALPDRSASSPVAARAPAYFRPLLITYKLLYSPRMKPVEFPGDSLEALWQFPRGARRAAGFQLDKVQRGLDPDDSKPLKTVGAGINEIRLRDAAARFVLSIMRAWRMRFTCCIVSRNETIPANIRGRY